MAANTLERTSIPEIKQTACVHIHDQRARTPIWIGPSTIMWLCADCADGVNKELVAVLYCADCTESLREVN